MIDEVNPSVSIRGKSKTLGLRRQTYHQRKAGHRPEQADAIIADLLHATTKRFIAWGFWMVFYFLRKQGFVRFFEKERKDLHNGMPHIESFRKDKFLLDIGYRVNLATIEKEKNRLKN